MPRVQEHEQPTSTPSGATASSQTPATERLPSQPSGQGDSPSRLSTDKAKRILLAHYAQYKDSADFAFLRKDWSAVVERHGELLNLPVDRLIQLEQASHRGKTSLRMSPVAGTVAVRADADRSIITFVLRKTWNTPAPAALRHCGWVDDSFAYHPQSVMHHEREVVAELGVDATERFVSYLERPVARQLRVDNGGEALVTYTTPPTGTIRAEAAETDAGVGKIASGAIVEDLGETFTCLVDREPFEVDTLRKVRHQGQVVWILDSWSWNTGHSWVGDNTLRRLDAGR